jgi:hypothetical protein
MFVLEIKHKEFGYEKFDFNDTCEHICICSKPV